MKRVMKIFTGIACACIGIGILLAMVAIGLGGRRISHGDNSYSYSYKVKDITSINLDVKFGKVKVLEGDEFTAQVNNVLENGFEGYVEDGTWYLEQKGKITDTINLFGWDIPFSFGWFNHNSDDFPTIVVTVPKDFNAQNLEINLGAGDLTVEELDVQQAKIEIDAGRIEVRRLNAAEKISCKVGAGELVLDKLQTKNADFDCDMGVIDVSGEILGDLKAECGMGRINFDLSGNEEDYNYYVDCDLGNIYINGHNYSVSSEDRIQHDNAIGTYDLTCNLGSLELDIK